MNREEWLGVVVEELRHHYNGELPETVHVTVSFPSGGARGKTIGQCWYGEASEDGNCQILIHPKVSDGVEAAEILVHELVHASRPDAKHGKAFKQLAESIGLEGKMTATHAGSNLRAELQTIVDRIGPYPHPALSGQGRKKQTTRLIKCQCILCDYTVRTTAKWLEVGLPLCPDGDPMFPELPEGEEGE